MSDEFDVVLCKKIQKDVESKLQAHDQRFENHNDRISELERRGEGVDAKIDNLCTNLQSLTITLRWFIGALVGSLSGFFFYIVQTHIIK